MANNKYYLMVKMALKTNLKYLCKTKQNPYSYQGSGLRWLNHLKKHNSWIVTCIIGEYNSEEELKQAGIYYSKLYNVVESDDWANLRLEEGDGGGAGKIGRRWKISNTSNMKGNGNRQTKSARDGYKKMAQKMLGKNNPRNKYPPSKKQREYFKRRQKIGTEASKKAILATEPDGTERIFESKRSTCYYYNITYDILNYRLKKRKTWKDISFKQLEK